MNEVRVRAAIADDLEAVRNLLAAASLPQDGVTDFFPDSYAIGERRGEVVAAIGVERYGDHALLRSAVVADHARGAGVGSRLALDRLDWCKTHGLRTVYLLTTTAAPFFEKLGFVQVQRDSVPAEVAAAPEFASICPSSAVVMRYHVS